MSAMRAFPTQYRMDRYNIVLKETDSVVATTALSGHLRNIKSSVLVQGRHLSTWSELCVKTPTIFRYNFFFNDTNSKLIWCASILSNVMSTTKIQQFRKCFTGLA